MQAVFRFEVNLPFREGVADGPDFPSALVCTNAEAGSSASAGLPGNADMLTLSNNNDAVDA